MHWTTREFIGHTWELSTPWSGHTISRSMRMRRAHIHMIHHFPLPSPSDAHVDAAPLARAALLAELDRGGGVVGAALRKIKRRARSPRRPKAGGGAGEGRVDPKPTSVRLNGTLTLVPAR